MPLMSRAYCNVAPSEYLARLEKGDKENPPIERQRLDGYLRSHLIDPELVRSVDRVVLVGGEAQVEPVDGMRGTIETWVTDEPSLRGIEGEERMRLVRDDIDARVLALLDELVPDSD